MLEQYIPIARLENEVLIVKANDVPKIGRGPGALEVQSVVVDLTKSRVEGPHPLELHLKFNPWEEVKKEEYAQLMATVTQVLAEVLLKEKFDMTVDGV